MKDIHINLLHFERDGDSHYYLIRDFNKMLSFTSKNYGKRFHCSHCFHGFTDDKLLEKHIPFCAIHGHQRTALPGPNEVEMKFTQWQKMLKVSFVIYADFECILKPIERGRKEEHPSTLWIFLPGG